MSLEFSLGNDFLSKYESRVPDFGYNGLGEIVYKRTYSRVMENGNKEEWFDTITRVVNGLFSYQKRSMKDKWDETKAMRSAKEVFERMFSLKFLPGGRVLWTGGTSVAERSGMCLYNCSFISTKAMDKGTEQSIEPFIFLMDLMMHGVGVGFDVEGENKIRIYKPTVEVETFSIEDTREGWVDSLGKLLESYFTEGHATLAFDYSLIRGKGLPLKSFGGVSSGFEPLRTLHKDIVEILERSSGDMITCRNIVDIMNLIGVCVVAGNCRRCLHKNTKVTTKNGLVDIQDIQIGDNVLTLNGFKKVYDVIKQGKQKLVKVVSTSGDYVLCTPNHKIAVKSANNGYIWKHASDLNKQDRLFKSVNTISGSTILLPEARCDIIKVPTLDIELAWFLGIFQTMGQINDNDITIPFYASASGLIFNVITQLKRFSSNLVINITEIKNLGWLKIICKDKNLLDYFTEYMRNIPELLYKASLFTKYSFLSGIIDMRNINDLGNIIIMRTLKENVARSLNFIVMSSGVNSILTKDKEYSIISVNRNQLNHVAKYCKISKFYNTSKKRKIANYLSNKIKYKSYVSIVEETDIVEETYDLSVEDNHQFYADGILVSNSAEISLGSINNQMFIELKNYEKNPERAAFGWSSNNTVMADIGDSYKEVAKTIMLNGEPGILWRSNMREYSRMCDPKDYVDKNTDGVNPCSEISLESGEMCNLAEIFLPRHSTFADFKKTLKCAYITAKSVTMLNVHWEKTNEVIKRNRRIGVSLSGIAMFLANHSLEEFRVWMDDGYKYLRSLDNSFSEIFDIPKSIKLTCVKPSGTTSLLAGASPGIHSPISRFYIRRIRIAKGDKIMNMIKKCCYPFEDCAMGTDNYVVDIPVDVGEGVKTNPTMFQQLILAEFMQKYWSDNLVSCTVTFDPDTEGPLIETALDHFQYTLKSISMLPADNTSYKQMPYSRINEQTYKKMMKKIKLKNHKSIEQATMLEISEESDPMIFCDNVSCMKL
jgi:intein/homing endonuclease